MFRRVLFLIVLSLLAAGVRAQTLTFSFVNANLIQGGPTGNQLQFDILMACSVAGTWHVGGNLYLSYNTQAFGDSISARGGLSLARLTLLQPTSFNVTHSDFDANTLSINWFNTFGLLGFPPNPIQFRQVPTALTPLCRVTMNIQDMNHPIQVSFEANTINALEPFIYVLSAPNNFPQVYPSPFNFGPPIDFSVLSAEQLYFDALAQADGVALKWNLPESLAVDRIYLERSANGHDFFTLHEALPQVRYHFDAQALPGRSWYRIVIRTESGELKYGPARELWYEQSATGWYWTAPSQRLLRLPGKSATNCQLSLSDASGRQVLQQAISLGQHEVTLKGLPKGLYFARITTTDGRSQLLPCMVTE